MKRKFGFLFVLVSAFSACTAFASGQIPQRCMDWPPYSLEMNAVFASYSVPSSRLAPWIPGEFDLFSQFGRSPLLLISAHYSKSSAAGSTEPSEVYDEFSYVTLVSYRGKVGGYFLRLDLNSQLALDLGRECYGFPKYLAQIDHRESAELFEMFSREVQSSRFLGGLVAEKGSGIINLLAGGGASTSTLITEFFKQGAFFERGGSLVWADLQLDAKWQKARHVQIRNATFPVLAGMGLLSPEEVRSPLGTVYFEGAMLTLRAPVVLKR
jgi:hypothetical protein